MKGLFSLRPEQTEQNWYYNHISKLLETNDWSCKICDLIKSLKVPKKKLP